MTKTKEKHNFTLLTILLIAGSIATTFIMSEPKNSHGALKELNLVGKASSFTPFKSKLCPSPQITYTLDDLVTISGCYTIFSNFPMKFFDESVVSQKQVIRTTDAQYLSLRRMHNGNKPYNFTNITYGPQVYGTTRPDGIELGDAAFPSLNNGHPRWEVMAHEQGHNFFGGTSAFYGALAFGHPFLQESLAVLSAFFTYHDIVDSPKKSVFSKKTIGSLKYDFGNGRKYQESQYNLYLSLGSPFNVDDVLTSQALDYKMITYGEKYGWNSYIKFAKAFENGIAPQFTFHHDGASATEQSTYVVAALGAAFNRDFRPDFRELNFPIDEVLYAEVYPKIKNYIM